MSAVAPSSPTSLAGGPVQVQFQLGLFREEVRVPAGNLSYRHAKRLAAEIIERKVIKASRWWARFVLLSWSTVRILHGGSGRFTSRGVLKGHCTELTCEVQFTRHEAYNSTCANICPPLLRNLSLQTGDPGFDRSGRDKRCFRVALWGL